MSRSRFSRGTARTLRLLLDIETVEVVPHKDELGLLESLRATDGVVGLLLNGKKGLIQIDAPDWDREQLRTLRGQEVVASWVDTIISDSQRLSTVVTRSLVELASAHGDAGPRG